MLQHFQKNKVRVSWEDRGKKHSFYVNFAVIHHIILLCVILKWLRIPCMVYICFLFCLLCNLHLPIAHFTLFMQIGCLMMNKREINISNISY